MPSLLGTLAGTGRPIIVTIPILIRGPREINGEES
jgi:hypothetical protein